MAPGTNIGAAHPVSIGGGDVPSAMNEKVVNDMVAFARSIAGQRGRNAEWLEDSVRKSVSITAEEAYEKNVIDLVAEDLPTLIKKLDGWEIMRKGSTRTLHTAGVEQRTISSRMATPGLEKHQQPQYCLYFAHDWAGRALFRAFSTRSHPPRSDRGHRPYSGPVCLTDPAGKLCGHSPHPPCGAVFHPGGQGGLSWLAQFCRGVLARSGIPHAVPGPGHTNRLAMSVFIPTVLIVSGFFVTVASLAFRAQMRRPQIRD